MKQSMRERIVEVLEEVFQRGYKHGVSGGQSKDGEFYAVDFGADRILAIVREGLPKEKLPKSQMFADHSDGWNDCLTDVIAKLEEK